MRRLEALENTLSQRIDATAGESADATRGLESRALRLTSTRSRPCAANALLSLAVNANVRLDGAGTECAIEYFEQRLRAGPERLHARAPGLLPRALRPASRRRWHGAAHGWCPIRSLYYNLACTYALPGGSPRWPWTILQCELVEDNHPTPRAHLERQQEWARGDPDLRSPRGPPALPAPGGWRVAGFGAWTGSRIREASAIANDHGS